MLTDSSLSVFNEIIVSNKRNNDWAPGSPDIKVNVN